MSAQQEWRKRAQRSSVGCRHPACAPHRRGTRTRGYFRGPRAHRGRLFNRRHRHMHLHLRKFWPAVLLLLAAPSAWAIDHRVDVGGSYDSGGYTYPQNGFVPRAVTVDVGDTVTFVNAGGTHNVDADDGTTFRCANGCDGAGGNGDPSGA